MTPPGLDKRDFQHPAAARFTSFPVRFPQHTTKTERPREKVQLFSSEGIFHKTFFYTTAEAHPI
jgi:hypothetical protein